MILGIDGSNIQVGGGVTHLVELLRAVELPNMGFDKVIIWGSRTLLVKIEDRRWLQKVACPQLDAGALMRIVWRLTRIGKLARSNGCNVIFVPGGADFSRFLPVVTVSQNMLPFEWGEIKRYGFSWRALKMLLLRIFQRQSFERASGVIFLTHYAKDAISRSARLDNVTTSIIPHGIDQRFVSRPRTQEPISCYSEARPFRLLYVSVVEMYKHQWVVADAVAELRRKGVPVTIEFVGGGFPAAKRKLMRAIKRVDPAGKFIIYKGSTPHGELAAKYRDADLFVFASSCENLPNIVIEAMASGLPIVCSDRGPMREVLQDGGQYFDPENAEDIARAISAMIESPETRKTCADRAFELAANYSWRRCARDTFEFLRAMAR